MIVALDPDRIYAARFGSDVRVISVGPLTEPDEARLVVNVARACVYACVVGICILNATVRD